MDIVTLNTFLDDLYFKGKLYTNQFTLAVDNLPAEGEDREYMIQALGMAIWYKQNAAQEMQDTELHLTVNSWSTLKGYLDASNFELEDLRQVALLSISSPISKSELEEIREWAPDIVLNWQVQPYGRFNREKFENRLANFDQAYFIIHKGPDMNMINPGNWHAWYSKIYNLPLELRDKIHIDSCAKDNWKFQRSGFGCSANISKIHIWPDGHVTGCPYNQRTYDDRGTEAATAAELHRNIKLSSERYEYRDCKLDVGLQPSGLVARSLLLRKL